jgi:hypothetical protein
MKFYRLPLLFLLLNVGLANTLLAQSKTTTFTIANLAASAGEWKGTLTYLDYTSGKPYTMPANLMVAFTADKAGYILKHIYPDEPKANATDTTFFKDGKFGDEKVAEFDLKPSGEFTLITEHDGVDGNDNKPATLRHIYKLEGNSLLIKKEVKFKGNSTWIKRNEYLFTKEHKVAETGKSLYNKIAEMDSLLFGTYNTQDVAKMKTYFTTDLEWYQDNGGLLNFETVFTNFQSIFNRPDKLNRELVPATLEVIPIKGFGAIEIGKHRFKHYEDGKLQVGTFRFVMIWKNENEDWKVSRVISFDH